MNFSLTMTLYEFFIDQFTKSGSASHWFCFYLGFVGALICLLLGLWLWGFIDNLNEQRVTYEKQSRQDISSIYEYRKPNIEQLSPAQQEFIRQWNAHVPIYKRRKKGEAISLMGDATPVIKVESKFAREHKDPLNRYLILDKYVWIKESGDINIFNAKVYKDLCPIASNNNPYNLGYEVAVWAGKDVIFEGYWYDINDFNKEYFGDELNV